MVIARRIAGALLLVASACALWRTPAGAADAPVIESIVDRNSGAVLWSMASPSAGLQLKPGQAILLKGRNFGPGPLTAARPGLGPPAGGMPPAGGRSIAASPPEAAGKELSKVLFGTARALERNLSSYRAQISLSTALTALLTSLQSQPIDYFYEPWVRVPDTWAGDIYGWSDTEIDLTVPITAYEGPIQVIRIPVTGAYVTDIKKPGQPVLYEDPNTARVEDNKAYVFRDLWRIARTGEAVLASNAVPATIALAGADRLQVGPAAGPDAEARAREMLAAADTVRLVKARPTLRSAADQYAYGERAFWAWDWNLAFPHLVLGVDWDGIFGFGYDRERSKLEGLARTAGYWKSRIPAPATESEGYSLPVLGADGAVKEVRLHKAMIDRITGQGIRPLTSFGAIPLLPDAGADRVIAPPIAFDRQPFAGLTPYPITMAFQPIPKPLSSAETKPTGWAGYVFAEVGSLYPTSQASADWIGFNCAACHAARVTYQYEPGGKRVSRFFSGIPNPDWRATFLALSGRAIGLVAEEPLPINFIRRDYPEGTRTGIVGALDLGNNSPFTRAAIFASRRRVDKTLLLYSLPPGATESTLFNAPSDTNQYGNDYFFSPQAIPIISNHTPVRRALSRSELIDGFEGAYLHGEEPEGARGPMSSRSLQDLTLYDSTLRHDDEPLRRIGLYRWLAYKNHLDWLGGAVNEGTFVSFGYQPDELLRPPSFPPPPPPASGLNTMRDAATAGAAPPAGGADPFAQRFPDLATHVGHGATLFQASCGRCHASGNAGLWTNEDMHPISAAGGGEPVGRYFSPTGWQRTTQSIRTAILENLFWLQQRGLLSDGHIVGDAPDNMDGLDLLVRPERCRAPLNADGSVDLAHASDLYKRLYTIHQGPGHSFRIPSAGMHFELYTRFGDKPGVLQQVAAPDSGRKVTEEEGRFVERHAYFSKHDDGYYYWDYQKMRRDYGILEYGLDPADPVARASIGGLPAAPHPWCMPDPSSQADIDDLVAFLLTL